MLVIYTILSNWPYQLYWIHISTLGEAYAVDIKGVCVGVTFRNAIYWSLNISVVIGTFCSMDCENILDLQLNNGEGNILNQIYKYFPSRLFIIIWNHSSSYVTENIQVNIWLRQLFRCLRTNMAAIILIVSKIFNARKYFVTMYRLGLVRVFNLFPSVHYAH